MKNETESHGVHENMYSDKKAHHNHHEHMVSDFKRRFWISLIITVPILALSPMIQEFLGLRETLKFTGSSYVLFALSSVVFFYGGYPFLKGLFKELRSFTPGMMTLIAIAIAVAYIYSSAVVFGLSGKIFFLGARNTYRHYASRPLDRDEIHHGSIKSTRKTCQADAF